MNLRDARALLSAPTAGLSWGLWRSHPIPRESTRSSWIIKLDTKRSSTKGNFWSKACSVIEQPLHQSVRMQKSSDKDACHGGIKDHQGIARLWTEHSLPKQTWQTSPKLQHLPLVCLLDKLVFNEGCFSESWTSLDRFSSICSIGIYWEGVAEHWILEPSQLPSRRYAKMHAPHARCLLCNLASARCLCDSWMCKIAIAYCIGLLKASPTCPKQGGPDQTWSFALNLFYPFYPQKTVIKWCWMCLLKPHAHTASTAMTKMRMTH